MAEIPVTAKFLNVTPLGLDMIIKLMLLSLLIVLIYEVYKLIYNFVQKVKHND